MSELAGWVGVGAFGVCVLFLTGIPIMLGLVSAESVAYRGWLLTAIAVLGAAAVIVWGIESAEQSRNHSS